MRLNMKILPYYRIEKTKEGEQFFFSHFGYFNFWDEYLIMNIKEGHGKAFAVLVNRPNRKFEDIAEVSEDYNVMKTLHIKKSVRMRKPKEMFEDFPELDRLKEKF